MQLRPVLLALGWALVACASTPEPTAPAQVANVYGPASLAEDGPPPPTEAMGGLVGRAPEAGAAASTPRSAATADGGLRPPERCPNAFEKVELTCLSTRPEHQPLREGCRAGDAAACEGYGRAVLDTLRPEHERYEALGIVEPVQTRSIVRYLKTKTELLKVLEPAYLGVARFGGTHWCRMAAATRVGELYLHLAGSLDDLKAPQSLTPEQSQLYRSMLLEKTAPLYDRAREAFEVAVQHAQEGALDDDLSQLATRRLAQLRRRPATTP